MPPSSHDARTVQPSFSNQSAVIPPLFSHPNQSVSHHSAASQPRCRHRLPPCGYHAAIGGHQAAAKQH
eukprot:1833363-Lingulodinium_polyedra.AAC.1